MKKMLLLTVACLTLSSCAGCLCSSKPTVTNPTPGPAPTLINSSPSASVTPVKNDTLYYDVDTSKGPVTYSKDTWALVLTSSWKLEQSNNKIVKLIAKSEELGNLILLTEEPTKDSFEKYSLDLIRTIKDQGGIIDSATKADINGVKYTKIQSSKKDVVLWQWVCVNKGNGYIFACGGREESVETNKAICESIASTFRVY